MSGPAVVTPERWGSLSAVGLAKEATFGTPVTPSTFLPSTGCTILPDPGFFSPQVMQGVRDVNIYPLYGEYKFTGAVEGPIFPTNGVPLLFAGVGADGGRLGVGATSAGSGLGVTGTAGGSLNTTLSSPVSSTGATTISVAANTGIVANTTIIQIDVNNTTTPTTAEVRKVTAISGSGPYTLTLDSALSFTHASAAPVVSVVAPFSHNAVQENNLDSLTIEKQLGGYQSEQYAGCKINKFSLKSATGNQEASLSCDIMAQNYAILSSPSAISVVNESPFVFAEAALTLYGTQLYQGTSFTMDIENGLKDTYTFAQQHQVQYLSPLTRKISGQISLVFTSLNDATYGYYALMFGQAAGTSVPGSLSFALQHPGSVIGGASFTLSKVSLTKYGEDVKLSDVIISTLDYEAFLNLGTTPPTTISATVSNSVYLPY